MKSGRNINGEHKHEIHTDFYALNNRAATLSPFVVRGDGSLVRLELGAADGFPANAVGLAAR